MGVRPAFDVLRQGAGRSFAFAGIGWDQGKALAVRIRIKLLNGLQRA
jgi:hypothetical protein